MWPGRNPSRPIVAIQATATQLLVEAVIQIIVAIQAIATQPPVEAAILITAATRVTAILLLVEEAQPTAQTTVATHLTAIR